MFYLVITSKRIMYVIFYYVIMWIFTKGRNDVRVQILVRQMVFPNTRIQYSVRSLPGWPLIALLNNLSWIGIDRWIMSKHCFRPLGSIVWVWLSSNYVSVIFVLLLLFMRIVFTIDTQPVSVFWLAPWS